MHSLTIDWYTANKDKPWHCVCGLDNKDECKCEKPKYEEEITPLINIPRAVEIKRAARALTEAAWSIGQDPEPIGMGAATDDLMEQVGIDVPPLNTARQSATVHPR